MTRARKPKPKRGPARPSKAKPPPRPRGRPGLADEVERLSVSLPRDLHARLLRAVVDREQSAGAIVRAALERELG